MSYIICLSAHSLISSKWLFSEEHSVTFITDDMNTDDWADVVEVFNEDLKFKNSTNMIQRSSDILIDMTALIDQEFTLIRAFWLILMRPEWLTEDENQCVEWIWCLKQNNRCTIFYCLINKDVKVEEDILNRQTLQKKFDRMTLELQKKSKNINSIVLSDDKI